MINPELKPRHSDEYLLLFCKTLDYKKKRFLCCDQIKLVKQGLRISLFCDLNYVIIHKRHKLE